jgi:hypothetical protein
MSIFTSSSSLNYSQAASKKRRFKGRFVSDDFELPQGFEEMEGNSIADNSVHFSKPHYILESLYEFNGKRYFTFLIFEIFVFIPLSSYAAETPDDSKTTEDAFDSTTLPGEVEGELMETDFDRLLAKSPTVEQEDDLTQYLNFLVEDIIFDECIEVIVNFDKRVQL